MKYCNFTEEEWLKIVRIINTPKEFDLTFSTIHLQKCMLIDACTILINVRNLFVRISVCVWLTS